MMFLIGDGYLCHVNRLLYNSLLEADPWPNLKDG